MPKPNSDPHQPTRRRIELWCGKTKSDQIDWAAASDPDPAHNCFGFALGHLQWWEPPVFIDEICANDDAVWPPELPHGIDVDNYAGAAVKEGFVLCPDGAWKAGFEKIMLYFVERTREFQHAAKQVAPGVWASKLGTGSDVAHAIDGIDRIDFGHGRMFMKRPLLNRDIAGSP